MAGNLTDLLAEAYGRGEHSITTPGWLELATDAA